MLIYISKVLNEFFSSVKFFFELSGNYKLILLLFFSLIVVLFETLSLSLIYNITNIVLNNNVDSSNFLIQLINSFFNINHDNLSLIIILTLLIIIFFKNILQIFIIILKNNFFLGMHSFISKEIYKKYLHQNFNFYINKNSSDLISSVLQDVGLSMKSFEAIFNIFSECLLISIIFSYLLYIDTSMAMIFLIGSFVFFIFYLFFTKKKLVFLSKERQILNESIIKDLQQSFSSFREVIIYSLRKIFINSMNYKFNKFFSNIKYASILQQTTRIAIEQAFIILIILAAITSSAS